MGSAYQPAFDQVVSSILKTLTLEQRLVAEGPLRTLQRQWCRGAAGTTLARQQLLQLSREWPPGSAVVLRSLLEQQENWLADPP